MRIKIQIKHHSKWPQDTSNLPCCTGTGTSLNRRASNACTVTTDRGCQGTGQQERLALCAGIGAGSDKIPTRNVSRATTRQAQSINEHGMINSFVVGLQGHLFEPVDRRVLTGHTLGWRKATFSASAGTSIRATRPTIMRTHRSTQRTAKACSSMPNFSALATHMR